MKRPKIDIRIQHFGQFAFNLFFLLFSIKFPYPFLFFLPIWVNYVLWPILVLDSLYLIWKDLKKELAEIEKAN